MIREITTDDLRRMENKEGLILQDCGGDLQEWQDGINDLLTKENILLDGSKFENCFSFEHKGITCLLFPFEENVKLDTGKLAIWRLRSHSTFGGTWLSDYVPIRSRRFYRRTSGTAETGLSAYRSGRKYI